MKRYKSLLAVILSVSLLAGCGKAIDTGALAEPLKNFNKDIEEAKELFQASNSSDKKDSQPAVENKTSSEKPAEQKPAAASTKTQPKSTNTAKKIVAEAPKKPVPAPKPAVTSTVQKVEIPVPPPAPSTNTTAQTAQAQQQTAQAQTVASAQPAQSTTTSNVVIPGLPAINYEVNNKAEFYKAVYNSLKDFETSVYIKVNNYDSNVYNLDIIDDIVANDYDVDYGLKSVGAVIYTMGDINVLNVKYRYSFTKDKLLAMRNATDSKAAQVIGQIIKPGMSDLDKEKAIHDYIVKNTAYDYDNYLKGTLPLEVFNAYGALINGSAVCEGYSKAMLKLMRMAGLDAKSVTGYGLDGSNKIPHAWNMVKINGAYTLVDATWDDPVPDQKDQVYYDYFNISDAQMAKDHEWDMSKYPKAVAVK